MHTMQSSIDAAFITHDTVHETQNECVETTLLGEEGTVCSSFIMCAGLLYVCAEYAQWSPRGDRAIDARVERGEGEERAFIDRVASDQGQSAGAGGECCSCGDVLEMRASAHS